MNRAFGGKPLVVNHEPRTTMILLLAIASCVLPDAKLGDGAESTGPELGDSSDSTVTVTTEDGVSGPIEPATPGVGAPCDHGWEPGKLPKARLLTFPAAGCDGLICLYANDAEPPADLCNTDADCNSDDSGVDQFACDVAESSCELSAAFIDERSMCSAFCEVDADCATDEATTCMSGFVCAPMSSLGEACCQPVCVCADDLDVANADELRSACEEGTQEGCCDNLPGNGLCPG